MSLAVCDRVCFSSTENDALTQVTVPPKLLQAVLVPGILFDRPSFALGVGDCVRLCVETQFGPLRAFANKCKRVPFGCREV